MLCWAGCPLIAGEGLVQSEALAVLSAILQLSALHDLDMTSHCDFFTHKSISIFSNEVGSLSQFSLKLHHASIILSLGVWGWGGGTSNSFRLTPKHSLPCFLCGNAIMEPSAHRETPPEIPVGCETQCTPFHTHPVLG